MGSPFTHANIEDVEDAAVRFGLGDRQEARFAADHVGAEQVGFSHHRVKPGKRQGFGHRHERTEEVYFVVSGSGLAKLDDAVVELRPRDVLRVAPGVTRAFAAGPDGLEVLAFSARARDDRGELLPGWW
jgi:uncharacterized cupin superfamily protein